MRADEMVAQYGDSLIGKIITTQAYGKYPGDPATIIKLIPDSAASAIPIQVKYSAFGTVGIFEYEEVYFYQGLAQTQLIPEEHTNDHTGQIFNPYTERWSWI